MPESFSVKDLGEVITKTLGLQSGDNIEIKRDRANPNRIMVVKLVD